MSFDGFLAAGFALSCPILLAALGELIVERAGILNIGLEGMMLIGAFAAAVAAAGSGGVWGGVLAGSAAGALAGLAFALVAVGLAADQIIVGAAINLIALGGTGALYRALFGETGTALVLPALPRLSVPYLSDLPLVGRALFDQHALVYIGLLLVPGLAVLLERTGLGLRLRALGDQPHAAASLGLPVRGYRVVVVVLCGSLAGLAGSALTLWTAGTFVEGVTAGRGFVALAVVVFARWSPWGVLGGSLLFGVMNALQFQFQASSSSLLAELVRSLPGPLAGLLAPISTVALPYQAFLMLPYVVTLAALLVRAGVERAPRALGARYERS